MKTKTLKNAKLAFFSSLDKVKDNKSMVNDDTMIFIEDNDSFGQWRTAYSASDRVGHYDTNTPICTLPKGWRLCYVVYNWTGGIDWNSFNGAYLIPVHTDPVFFINFEIGLQVKENGQVMLYSRGNAGDATVHKVFYI